jgi:ubiquinone biosynthesis protein
MEQWMRNRIGPRAALERMRREMPALSETLPELAHHTLRHLQKGEGFGGGIGRKELQALREELRESSRRTQRAVIAAASGVAAALLYVLGPDTAANLAGVPWSSWLLGALALCTGFSALRRRAD